MTAEELRIKAEQIRGVTDAKMKYLRDHARLLDQAFEELKQITEEELDLIYAKIKELDDRMNKNGLSE